MFDLAREYKQAGMTSYCKLQEEEFASEKDGYEGVKHQRFVGTGYFDAVQQAITSGKASTTALDGSTEAAQFHPHAVPVHKAAVENKRVAAD
jgi:isocitrate lyase